MRWWSGAGSNRRPSAFQKPCHGLWGACLVKLASPATCITACQGPYGTILAGCRRVPGSAIASVLSACWPHPGPGLVLALCWPQHAATAAPTPTGLLPVAPRGASARTGCTIIQTCGPSRSGPRPGRRRADTDRVHCRPPRHVVSQGPRRRDWTSNGNCPRSRTDRATKARRGPRRSQRTCPHDGFL
jgi:hypothetical protein